MKNYLQIYLEFFKTSLAEAGTYRINFFLLFILDIAFYLSSYAPSTLFSPTSGASASGIAINFYFL